MEKPDLEVIIRAIKSRGLNAYQISKDLPISEVGINKILNRETKRPQKSTLLLLHNYLFNNEEVKNEKTPPEEVRFEDLIAEKVFERLEPFINGNSEKLIKAIMNLHLEINTIKIAQKRTQESVEVIEKRV